MSKTDIWMPLYIADYLADTQHLTRDEHGGYLLLLMAYWRNGGPLQDDDKRLAAISKATQREWKQLRPALAEFFDIEDGYWVHKRADKEIKDATENSLRNTSRAKKAASKRWNKQCSDDAPSNAPSIPKAELDQCPSPSPTPLKTPIASDNVNPGGGTIAGSICARLKKDGVQGVNPQHPKLLALLEAGLTADEITTIGPDAAAKGKGFAWVLAAAEGRRRDAAKVGELPSVKEKPWFIQASKIEERGRELGVSMKRDEVFPVFRDRVYEAAGVTAEMVRKANIDFGART